MNINILVINFVCFPFHCIPVPGLTQGIAFYGPTIGTSLSQARTIHTDHWSTLKKHYHYYNLQDDKMTTGFIQDYENKIQEKLCNFFFFLLDGLKLYT